MPCVTSYRAHKVSAQILACTHGVTGMCSKTSVRDCAGAHNVGNEEDPTDDVQAVRDKPGYERDACTRALEPHAQVIDSHGQGHHCGLQMLAAVAEADDTAAAMLTRTAAGAAVALHVRVSLIKCIHAAVCLEFH